MISARFIAVTVGMLAALAACDSPSKPPEPEATVSGRVALAPYSIPIEGADVTLDGTRQTRTNDDGRYTFTRVTPEADCVMTADHWKVHRVARTVTIVEHENVVDFDVVPEVPFAFTVRVIDAAGHRVRGATVSIGALHLTTDSSGMCRFDGLIEGDWYRLRVVAEGYQNFAESYWADTICLWPPCSYERPITVRMSPE
jgi:hypothetical protein